MKVGYKNMHSDANKTFAQFIIESLCSQIFNKYLHMRFFKITINYEFVVSGVIIPTC